MKLPLCLLDNLSNELVKNYELRFGNDGFDRSIRSNVWRRHQVESNAELSGWNTKEDERRRILQFYDQYSMNDNKFFLENPFLFLHYKLPKNEIDIHLEFFNEALYKGKWKIIEKGLWMREDLECQAQLSKTTEFDQFNFGSTWEDYKSLEIIIKKQGTDNTKRRIALSAFRTGIRKVEQREFPKYCEVTDIKDYFPAHIELGCGPSIECGIPALNTLHQIYSISKNKKFVFSASDEAFYEFLRNPEMKFPEACNIHVATLKAEYSPFYEGLISLIESRHLLEPIFTNNFDGLPVGIGIREHCLRKYDFDYRYPDYEMNSNAKALIVVGAHADRRYLQVAARKRGLKIIFVNPEGYFTKEEFVSYPLESPKNEDYVIKLTASEFMNNLLHTLKTL